MTTAEDADDLAQGVRPWLPATELHRLSSADALALVDRHFGDASEWPSPIIQYRLSSDFQADWKEEVGHWLHTADRHGFLQPLLNKVLKRTKRGTRSTCVDPNDRRHNELHQEMAQAMAVHYLSGIGWRFVKWEARCGGPEDVDIEMVAPGGTTVLVQVKAPDQPGGRAHGQVEKGEYDERVITAVENAAAQLPHTGPEAKVIVVSPNRVWPMSGNPQPLVSHLVGSTVQDEAVVSLRRSDLGAFFTPEWAHVGAVVVLDFARGIDDDWYACTVLKNPVAEPKADKLWFPRGRVCWFDGTAFWWTPNPPGNKHTLPDGTRIVDGENNGEIDD